MSRLIAGAAFGRHLIAVGLCPESALNIELIIPAGGVMRLKYEVVVRADDLPKIGEALTALHHELIEDKA